MLREVANKFNSSLKKIVFFGDRLYTVVTMGKESGVMTVLVLTGETEFEDLINSSRLNHEETFCYSVYCSVRIGIF